MKTDWKDALGALAAELPAAPAEPELSADTEAPAADGTPLYRRSRLRVSLERKGRGGKTATIISGFDDLDDSQLRQVASQLKQALATGGSARGGEILIQGDRVADVRRYFKI